MFDTIEAALTRGDPATAKALAREALAQQPDDPRLLRLLGVAQRMAGELQDAATSFDRALGLAPDDPMLHFGRAMLALSSRDSAAAVAELDRTLALDPNALIAYVLRGHAALAQGDARGAEAQLRLAQRVDAEHPHALTLEGNLALSYGRAQDAIRVLTQAVQRAPDDSLVLSSLGLAFLAGGNPAFASQTLRRAVELQPAARRLRLALIAALRQQRRLAEALAEAETLRQLNPADPDVPTLHIELRLAAGDSKGALQILRSLQAESAEPVAQLGRAIDLLLRGGAIDAARVLVDEALARKADDLALWRAGALPHSHDPATLAAYAGRWLEAHPENAEARLALAEAAEQMGDLARAEALADAVLARTGQRGPANFIKLRAELRHDPAAALTRTERLLPAARGESALRACLVWRGLALDALGRCDEAAASWLQARALPVMARALPPTERPTLETADSDEGAAPRLLWGPPGSPVRAVATLLQGTPGIAVLVDRFGNEARPDGLGPDRPDGAVAHQSTWRAMLGSLDIDPAMALDWLPSLDPRHFACLPDARLLAVLADPRDLLLNWLALGSTQEYVFPGAAEAGAWLAALLAPLTGRLAEPRAGDLVLRHEALTDDPAGACARIAAFLGRESALDANLLQRAGFGLGGQPLSLSPQRWRAYAEPLAEGFAPLHEVAVRLGYPAA